MSFDIILCWLPIEEIKSKITGCGVQCRSDIDAKYDLSCVISEDLVGHCMPDMLSDANKPSFLLTCLRGKIQGVASDTRQHVQEGYGPHFMVILTPEGMNCHCWKCIPRGKDKGKCLCYWWARIWRQRRS